MVDYCKGELRYYVAGTAEHTLVAVLDAPDIGVVDHAHHNLGYVVVDAADTVHYFVERHTDGHDDASSFAHQYLHCQTGTCSSEEGPVDD